MNNRNTTFKMISGLLILGLTTLCAQAGWQDMVSVKNFCEQCPEQATSLMNSLDLDYAGLEEVKSAHERGDMEQTLTHLLAYYKNKEIPAQLKKILPPPSEKTEPAAERLLTNTFRVQEVDGTVPYKADGHRDWYYRGPNGDPEWAWLSNRHPQLETLRNSYLRTGNVKYLQYIDLFLKDFILVSHPYPAKRSGDMIWRGLEISFRAKVWPRIFYNFRDSEYLSPATRLLMLSNLAHHAHYNRNFHAGGNWLTMEISGLAAVAVYFPEYKQSAEWRDYAVKTMTASMKKQVYPDGVQYELTSHYHTVALKNFLQLKSTFNDAGIAMPAEYDDIVIKMADYTAKTMRPDGACILNNDSDRSDDRPFVLKCAKQFKRPDWTYLATNGKKGTRPASGPSVFYPWAGQLISKSDYSKDAHWSFFDVGPWGHAHEHSDKLHLSIAAYGRDLLVDSGRFAYSGKLYRRFRSYAIGSLSHNTVSIDGKGQQRDQPTVDKPLDASHWRITAEYDYAAHAMDRFAGLQGKAKHTRAVLYVRGAFWVVVDRITTDQPRSIETLWHWHPACSVAVDNNIVKTTNERGNLAVIPVSDKPFSIKNIKGQENPVQGWYSEVYNRYVPNTTTSYATKIQNDSTQVWLLLPSEHEAPDAQAEVISSTNTETTLNIQIGRQTWDLTIPYCNSAGIRFSK